MDQAASARHKISPGNRLTDISRAGVVHAVIGVHNNVNYTIECLTALAEQTYSSLQVIIVDDGSTDGTTQLVRQRFPTTTVLQGDGNLWWTGTMRVGIEHVMKHAKPGDFILSMNNDVIFESDYVAGLVAVSEARGRVIVGSHGIIRGTDKISVQGGRFEWRYGRSNQSIEALRDPADPNILHKLDFLYGRGMLVPVEVVKDVGNFNDRDFKQRRSDKEFSYRAARAGWPLIISLTSLVYVTETPATSSIAFSASPTISYHQAWRVLAHVNSPNHLPTGWRFIKQCCPREYRLRNYALFLLTAFDRSFGRTAPLYYLIKGYRWLIRA
jgi:GT2 family glycosyltransferase